MLDHCLQHWSNIKTTLGQCISFADPPDTVAVVFGMICLVCAGLLVAWLCTVPFAIGRCGVVAFMTGTGECKPKAGGPGEAANTSRGLYRYASVEYKIIYLTQTYYMNIIIYSFYHSIHFNINIW